jgi:hypothetical protein
MIAGTFGFLAPKMNHFAMAKGDTVIQLHGIGPWQINYVNPVDDPRKKLFSRFSIKFGQLGVLLQIVNLYSSIRRSRSGRIVHFWIRDARQ